MGNKILFINACVRNGSRTKELAEHFLKDAEGEITEVNLYKENMLPLDGISLEKRMSGDFSEAEIKWAKQFADADVIVIAAPFWDLSFPAILKIYLENITVSGITFEYSNEGYPVGKCKAKKLYYITTSGGYIKKNNYGFDYIKALAQNFYGINDVRFFSAEGLDIFSADVNDIMEKAKTNLKKEGIKL